MICRLNNQLKALEITESQFEITKKKKHFEITYEYKITLISHNTILRSLEITHDWMESI